MNANREHYDIVICGNNVVEVTGSLRLVITLFLLIGSLEEIKVI
jgi:hypothetical protein